VTPGRHNPRASARRCIQPPGNRTKFIEHWNGTAWKNIPIHGLSGQVSFGGAAASSTRDAWAVGSTRRGSLTVRWNGRTWRTVRNPDPVDGSLLEGVTIILPQDAWAVGATRPGRTLILHWNGRAWN